VLFRYGWYEMHFVLVKGNLIRRKTPTPPTGNSKYTEPILDLMSQGSFI